MAMRKCIIGSAIKSTRICIKSLSLSNRAHGIRTNGSLATSTKDTMKSSASLAPPKAKNISDDNIKENVKFVLPKKCVGCGADFQNTSKLKAGYLPPINIEDRMLSSLLSADEERRIEMIEKSTEPISPRDLKLLLKKKKFGKSNVIVCWKCHSSGHQNLLQKQAQQSTILLKTNRTQFADLKINNGGLLVLVLDMLDLPNSIVENLTEYVGQKDLIIVLNKADVMPKNLNWARLTTFLKRYPIVKEAKAVIPISTSTGLGMDAVARHLIKNFERGHDCYLVGCTNAGKSSFMNYWKQKMGHQTMITTSITSGTTAGLLKLGTKDLWPVLKSEMNPQESSLEVPTAAVSSKLIDTAGIIKENQLYHHLTPRQLKYLVPTKPLTEHSLELRPNTSYWIGGLVRIDVGEFTPDSNDSFLKLYLAPKLKVFPSPIGKCPRPPKTMEKNLKNLPAILWAGAPKNNSQEKEEDAIDLKIAARLNHNSKQQVWISGVGWFNFSNMAPRFSYEVFTHLGKGISVTKAVNSL